VATSETVVACPTDDVLAAFAQRALAETEHEHISSHLDSCEDCRSAVRAVASPVPPDRYELIRLIGTGGMGQVYVAHDRELDRDVALKLLRPELAGSPAVLAERLVRESRLTAKVAHPAVMTVYDIGRAGDAVFIAMELIRGETLGAFVARTHPDWRTIVGLYERAAQGLAAAHAAGIVHRDFKPENVLVETAGERRVIVTDFGIARATDLDEPSGNADATDVRLTATGAAIGTPAYMAPEQLDGAAVDARADVFAFTVSLWEALCGARPFPGTTIAEIRAAMLHAPQPPRGLPRRLVRALERGIAIAPAARPDLQDLVAELAAARAPHRRVKLVAAGLGLVGAGVAGALALGSPPQQHPCAAGFARLAASYDHDAVARALAPDPKVSAVVLPFLDNSATKWRVTHAETCIATREPAQPPDVATCLEARRIELAGVAADVIADGPGHARALSAVVSTPHACLRPPPAAQFSRVPEDPALRRKVTAIRYRAFDAEALRDAGDFTTALAQEKPLVEDSKIWPPVAAEVQYLYGTTLSLGSDAKAALVELRKAAALAESVHHDYIASAAWTQLVFSATGDEGDPQRGLEYATYADAALDRMARPADSDALFQYAKGTTLVEAHKPIEAEATLRHAVELCEQSAPAYLPQAIQGLGYLYESQGRFGDAVAAYRDALAHLQPSGSGVLTAQVIINGRLAVNLSTMGQTKEAVKIARAARELAIQKLGEDNLDRVLAQTNLAQVLDDDGQGDLAIAETHEAVETLAKIAGERSQRYGEVLMLEGELLDQHERYTEAAPKLARACDVIGFANGEGSSQQAECWMNQTVAISGVGHDPEALALIEKTIPILVATYGEDHPQVANAILARGILHCEMHHHAACVADLERAAELFGKDDVDKGHQAAAQWALARELWPTDRKRAKELLATAKQTFATASPTWNDTRADLDEWLATDGHPRHPLHKTL